jgi:hypothetical protein
MPGIFSNGNATCGMKLDTFKINTLEKRENVLISLSPTLKLARHDEESEFTYRG